MSLPLFSKRSVAGVVVEPVGVNNWELELGREPVTPAADGNAAFHVYPHRPNAVVTQGFAGR